MTRWTWKKGLDDDGHVYWTGSGPRGERAYVWLSGGDGGEYLTEYSRHRTLAEAKAFLVRWWRE